MDCLETQYQDVPKPSVNTTTKVTPMAQQQLKLAKKLEAEKTQGSKNKKSAPLLRALQGKRHEFACDPIGKVFADELRVSCLSSKELLQRLQEIMVEAAQIIAELQRQQGTAASESWAKAEAIQSRGLRSVRLTETEEIPADLILAWPGADKNRHNLLALEDSKRVLFPDPDEHRDFYPQLRRRKTGKQNCEDSAEEPPKKKGRATPKEDPEEEEDEEESPPLNKAKGKGKAKGKNKKAAQEQEEEEQEEEEEEEEEESPPPKKPKGKGNPKGKGKGKTSKAAHLEEEEEEEQEEESPPPKKAKGKGKNKGNTSKAAQEEEEEEVRSCHWPRPTWHPPN
ncbi:hypothetical protein AK812_SmicGene40344 [Symbiodinium microadriaticum]|uniref:Uncharacterized protein n=1 Tax=Symbiodinium microadriaticum TaxID=2951 RepID=A0A1Q9C910_SYMMI|nr:hypothetical protein AK812_SmicGene40344 [Symbiodinium microadriaticum]